MLTSMPNDQGRVIFFVNTLLISCNTIVQQDTEMALKLEYIKAQMRSISLPCLSLRLARATAHIQKKATGEMHRNRLKKEDVIFLKRAVFI